ncbi:MAG: hypothetical protein RIG62_15220 [Cyclobacteriaceae bacterium]
MNLIWKSRTQSKKQTPKTKPDATRIHAEQLIEWEWLDQRLSKHFQQGQSLSTRSTDPRRNKT